MKILLTGFKPFNQEEINPSEILIKELEKDIINHQIESLLLDVKFYKDAELLINKIKSYQPDLVLSFGQAGGRSKITFEKLAINFANATIKDNDDKLIQHQEIVKDGPICYKSNIDTNKLFNKLNKEPFDISYHAGTFVCNEIYYQTLNYIYTNKLTILSGFIHLPFLDEQVVNKTYKYPSMSMEEIKEVILKTIDSITKLNK